MQTLSVTQSHISWARARNGGYIGTSAAGRVYAIVRHDTSSGRVFFVRLLHLTLGPVMVGARGGVRAAQRFAEAHEVGMSS